MDWQPSERVVQSANLTEIMRSTKSATVADFHRWSVENRDAFWGLMIERLGVDFQVDPAHISAGPASDTTWLGGAELNIATSCFRAPIGQAAVIYESATGLHTITTGQLLKSVQTCAAGLSAIGVTTGTPVAIAMPMTVESVIAYLAVVWAGGIVVSIADSFATPEIRTRLAIAHCSVAITQDVVWRGDQQHPMYQKLVEAGIDQCVVVETGANIARRPDDVTWTHLMAHEPMLSPVIQPATKYTNILFSSGTTGDPKAIPWDQTTPIKAASDGHIHQDIGPGDVVAWPTNLGWMMGPWLIYAALLNRATIALSGQLPSTPAFCEFVGRAGVTILGVVPALVRSWRNHPEIEDLDWSTVRVVSSTGEASTPDDMRWLMGVTGAPTIEYCGGTEIGGGYISSTVVEPFEASTFTTPCMGIDFRILDEAGRPSTEGEVFLVPPSIGLSTTLLNRDHTHVYYDGLPVSDVPLRRHGDQMRRLPSGHWRAMGRSDDTMNLGGIKISSAEIERAVASLDGLIEVAAVGVPPTGGGPEALVLFAVAPGQDAEALRIAMQMLIRRDLNPLFKVAEVRLVDELPRTASAKVMRRTLRSRL